MAKGDYYFPFYYQRFFSSTQGWTEEQEGAYMRLLTYQFDKGSIPNDLKIIKKISPKAAKNWSIFQSKFVQNSDGNFINPVMDEIRKKIQEKKDKNLKNGKLGGRPKTEGLQENKPNGYDLENQKVIKTETQTKPIPITNNQIANTNVLATAEAAAPAGVGIEAVVNAANTAWQDQAWREQFCIGLGINSQDELKRWMAQFNSSISNDSVQGFSVGKYKKIFRGWIIAQKQKGVTIDVSEKSQPQNSNYRLKKIS